MELLSDIEVIQRCRSIIRDAGLDEPTNFLDGARLVADIINDWSSEKQNGAQWLLPFARGLKQLQYDYSKIVEADPMILYKPAHKVALAFHQSKAFIRYNRSANRTSKSQAGYAEHYMAATGSNVFRIYPRPPVTTFLIGVDYSKYAPNVFERKFLHGEPGNPLSPMFPEGGKWFNRYDEKKKIIYLSCQECAEKGKAGSCKHVKSSISLFSDFGKVDVLQGAQYVLAHFDEHIAEEFFDEAFERVKIIPYSSIIITGTPLLGKSSWEYRRIESIYQNTRENKFPGRPGVPMVSVHSINQYDAGLVPRDMIDASRKTMDPLEQEARIFGRPAPLAKHSVFDRYALHEMEQHIREPKYGILEGLEHPLWKENPDGMLAVWEPPIGGGQYVIGCDISAGLTDRDYSCDSVVKLPELRLVAQLHGWINPLDHANESVKLARWYNQALLVPERTGLGIAMIQGLKEIGYWNVFRDVTDPSQAEYTQDPVYGVDTNIKTKAMMVSFLAQVVRERQFELFCAATLEEMRAFGQEVIQGGLNVRLGGEGGTNDDRVMSLVFAVYVALSFPIYEHAVVANPEHSDDEWSELHRELRQQQRSERDKVFYDY